MNTPDDGPVPARDDWGVPVPEDEVIVAGAWRVALRETELADITFDGTPVLRSVRFVVRDQDWRTADDTLLTREVTTDDDVTRIRITATSAFGHEPVVRWSLDARIDGDEFSVDTSGTATTTFRRNRFGLIVLHPPTLAGLPLTVHHPDGRHTDSAYPLWISPHQPATDVAGYSWTAGSVAVRMDLAGEVFEMEDQRNWTDASFKTYSPLLAKPYPVTVEPGTEVRESVTVRPSRVRPGGATTVLVDVPPAADPAPEPVPGPAPVLQLLAASAPAALRPAHDTLHAGVPILVEPDLGAPNSAAVLASARLDAVDAPLDVRFVTDDPVALRRAIDEVLASGPVVRVGAFDPRMHGTTPDLQRVLLDAARAHGDLEVVAGTRGHFTELNRTIDLFTDWDGALSFSVTPQMHDRTRAQVTESIRMQRWVVAHASRLAAGRTLHVGPVTLRPRFNAVPTSSPEPVTEPTIEAGYGPEFVPDATDPGQRSPAAEAWFADAVAALTVPGVATITLAEAWGPRGGVLPSGSR